MLPDILHLSRNSWNSASLCVHLSSVPWGSNSSTQPCKASALFFTNYTTFKVMDYLRGDPYVSDRTTTWHLDLVPASCMMAAGRPLPAGHGDMIHVRRLQPDMILISQKQKRIGILELCRPMDESPIQLQAAVDRKLQTYAPLKVALQQYPASGWAVEILPWVVGIRGLLKVSTFTPIFNFFIHSTLSTNHSSGRNCPWICQSLLLPPPDPTCSGSSSKPSFWELRYRRRWAQLQP